MVFGTQHLCSRLIFPLLPLPYPLSPLKHPSGEFMPYAHVYSITYCNARLYICRQQAIFDFLLQVL